MGLVETIGFFALVLAVLLIVAMVVRRVVLARAGGFDISWRSRPKSDARGWRVGQARYRGDELVVYRWFSPLPTAAFMVDRRSLELGSIRPTTSMEHDLLPPGAVIVPGTFAGATLELALAEDALTALRAWVESRPPGSGLPRRGLDTSHDRTRAE